jgi:hypothetical protein
MDMVRIVDAEKSSVTIFGIGGQKQFAKECDFLG